ncbi:nicotinate phosphoribosyltransferase [Buchnera aphidicola]|uniref:Nicotinate phosphoribosyltransferase n=1 Tax=Buchnera aphidicola subsp. Uroleucon sonchi TaxID=118118 RepID=A0A6C1FBL1_BUCUN|nr:nicotinate phosphoribosyltransferase [Buchnera aphidicola]QIE02067.1 nicotinate phosphoribosyltransferase [Buchnera aphidicola (Uroleucon sonchi)]
MKKYHKPIIKTLLDTDAYKFHMQQAIFYHYNNVHVMAEFFCRENNHLGCYANILLEQINMMQSLSLSHEEYIYMTSFPYFKKEYLKWLKNFRYNASQVKIQNNQGQLSIRISGFWKDIILWEVPILSIISEIFHRHTSPNINSQEAIRYLDVKLKKFFYHTNKLDLSYLNIIDFGTRRRFSYSTQLSIIRRLQEICPFFIGSSNYHIAHILKLNPFGTQAHEWFQAHQQISTNLKNSQILALKIWLLQYKNYLNIALTDSINMDAFLNDFNFSLASAYKGIRHDSGDALEWSKKAIKHYNALGINPLTKTLLFSDNLNFKKIIFLYKNFYKKINMMFGIGTKLTCDIPYVKPLNIVIKLVKCNGKPVAKISDSPGKTYCLDPLFLQILCKTFNVPYDKNR